MQTIYARKLARRWRVQYRRERWVTPDGDFIDLDWTPGAAAANKLLVLFHGLEGCSRSHYAMSFMTMAQQRGRRGVVPHFRGCSGEINKLPRAYHSGDAAEIDWILRRLKRENPDCEIYVAGVSLSGNMLLKWLGEQADAACAIVKTRGGGVGASGFACRGGAVGFWLPQSDLHAPFSPFVAGESSGEDCSAWARHRSCSDGRLLDLPPVRRYLHRADARLQKRRRLLDQSEQQALA
ncbi:MAG: YheT family hydrolase [Candidatus Binatia bacterium]